MLTHLSIRNIVLIESLDISLGQGFCVLTGETGAGKSIMLDALGLLLGSRAEARLIRQGQEEAQVAGEFTITFAHNINTILQQHDIPVEESLRIRRKITRDGKGRIFINDTQVGQGVLQQVGEKLVEVHGQHDQRTLTSTTTHRQMLDAYAGIAALLENLAVAYDNWQTAEARYAELAAHIAEAQREEEFLRHALTELTGLAAQSGEEEALAATRARLQQREKLLETLSAAQDLLTGKHDVAQTIHATERLLARNLPEGFDAETILLPLDRAGVEIHEALKAIDLLAASLDDGVETLDTAEERLFALRGAARKYECTPDELPAYREKIAAQLQTIEHQGEALEAAEIMRKETRIAYVHLAEAVRSKRQAASQKFSKEIAAELAPLKMASSQVKLDMLPLPEAQWSREGMDKVELLVSTNSGMPFGSLGKIASGGELSRLMLAIKVVLSGAGSTPTLIFDEIDTGIGGAVADAVGRRLAKLGQQAQVLCVTHQPQVASYGQQHLKVEKHERKGHTVTTVRQLSGDERREEIARMLAGDSITDEARAAAVKLMEAVAV